MFLAAPRCAAVATAADAPAQAILEPLQSSLLAVPHGFFTRNGGASTGRYASLNAAPASGDAPEAVAENRRRLAAWFAQPAEQLLSLRQCHSARCITVTAGFSAEEAPEADALVTKTPGLVLSVLTADCVPVLLHDPAAGVIGAAHAGWKGALAGIIPATLEAMRRLGSHVHDLRAVTGPSIAQASYEVDAAFHAEVMAADPAAEPCFTAAPETPGRYHFDNKAYVHAQLADAGVAHSDIMPHDTYQEAAQFFSYRRASHHDEPDYGRQLSAIMLKA